LITVDDVGHNAGAVGVVDVLAAAADLYAAR
jgi:hypothetical protein